MEIALSNVELELLLLLSHPLLGVDQKELVSDLMRKSDESELLRLICFHRVALAVNRNIEKNGQKVFSARFYLSLQEEVTSQSALIKRQFFHQTRIEKAFNAVGISYRVFKGLALSKLLYDDLGWRFSKDIDMLIAPSQQPKAMQVLQELGFDCQLEKLNDHGLGTRLRRRLQKDCLYTFADGTQLELHSRLDNTQCDFSAYMASLYLRQQEGFSVSELLYLCVHAANSQCHRIKWLVDISVYIHHLQQLLPNWQSEAERLAVYYGQQVNFRFILLLVSAAYPKCFSIIASDVEQQVVKKVYQSWLKAELVEGVNAKEIMMRLHRVRDIRYAAGFIINILYMPNYDDIKLLNSLHPVLGYLFLSVFPLYKFKRYIFRLLR